MKQIQNMNEQRWGIYTQSGAQQEDGRMRPCEPTGEPRIYRVIRFRFNGKPRTIKNHLTESEAQAHCNDPKTSSHSTGPGAWFDGYDYMKGYRPSAVEQADGQVTP